MNHTTLWNLTLQIFEAFVQILFIMNLSLIHSPDILALCEINMEDSIDSGNLSVRGYLPLIRKESTTYMHDLEVYMEEGLLFAQVLSIENSVDS